MQDDGEDDVSPYERMLWGGHDSFEQMFFDGHDSFEQMFFDGYDSFEEMFFSSDPPDSDGDEYGQEQDQNGGDLYNGDDGAGGDADWGPVLAELPPYEGGTDVYVKYVTDTGSNMDEMYTVIREDDQSWTLIYQRVLS